MNKVLKKALGFASALVLMAVMVLAASPVQASDVDTRIQALERELAQLRQNQESALAAEMKGPKFSYKAGSGVTVAAADNSWSVNLRNRMQVYSTFYLDNDDAADGIIRIRRARPRLIVTSQQGFYKLDTQYTLGTDGKVGALNADMYVNFGKTNPWLPNLGYGCCSAFTGSNGKGSGIENSILTDAANIGGQDRSVVFSWSGLPAMGTAQLTHLNVSVGHDGDKKKFDSNPGAPFDEPESRTVTFGFGIKPMAKVNAMGGFDVSSVAYSLGYAMRPDRTSGLSLATTYLVTDVTLASMPPVSGDHTYTEHGLNWSPLGFLSLNGNYATYEAKGTGPTMSADEVVLGASVKVWGPKSGLMGGGGSEGGISLMPTYSSAEVDTANGAAEVDKIGLGIVYAVPGGWMTVTGMWDIYGCEGDCADLSAGTGNATDDSFSVFTLAIDYKF